MWQISNILKGTVWALRHKLLANVRSADLVKDR